MSEWLSLLAATAEDEGIFGSLGIDYKILGLQALAFIILVVILGKFIYPQVNAMLDRRDKQINDAIEAAKQSEAKAAESEKKTAAALAAAREEAGAIVDTARKESADLMATAEFDAKKKADNIVREARVDIAKEIESAREQLRDETLDLVAQATEKIAGVKLTGDDRRIVQDSLGGKDG